MQFHIAYLSLYGDLLSIEAHEDQHEENAVKLISLIKRQIGFNERIDRYA
jgi:hypothetical protein